MDKKILYIGGGVVVAFIVLVVVLFSGNFGKSKTTTAINGQTVLTVWGLEDKRNFDEVINTFEQENSKITINYVQKSPNDYLQTSINEIATGKGPDIWAIPNDWLPQYHNMIVPLDDQTFQDSDTGKNGVEAFRQLVPAAVGQDVVVNNKIYGIPLSVDTLMLYWNQDIFSVIQNEHNQDASNDYQIVKEIIKNGPQNWDEFVFLTQFITEKSGDNIERSAVAMGRSDNVKQAIDILTLLMLQDGAKMTSDDLTTAQFHTAENIFGGPNYPGRQALDFYTSFANPQNENYTWSSAMPDSIRAFADNKVAMMIDYQSSIPEITNINPNINMKFLGLPQVKETKNPATLASYPIYTVTKASKDPNAAWTFILSLTMDRTSLGIYQNVSKNTPALVLGSDDPFSYAKNWFKPDPAKANDAFKEMIQQVNEGGNTQTALEGAAGKITTLLQNLKASSQ